MPPTAPVALHVETTGSGPVIALGHGFGGSARNLRGQARALADHWRVVRWDTRGHARSAAPADPGAYTLDALVGDVGAVLDHVSAPTAIVGGVSLGAALALRFALAHPQRVRGLVLAAYPAGPDVPGSYTTMAHQFADAIERDGLEAAGARFVWGPESGLDPAAAKLVRQGFLEHPPHALAAILRHVLARLPAPRAMAAELGGVTVPVLLVAGANDRGARVASEALASALPQARLAVFSDAGHLVNLARPDAFNAELRAFLETVA